MAMTGKVVKIELMAMATHHASAPRISRRQRLLCGLSAFAFLATVALPVTIDTASMAPGFKSALAAGGGNGNGNGDGQGKGNGNGKGQGDENGGPKKPPKGGTGDDDDDDYDDGDTGDDDDTGGSGGLGGANGGRDDDHYGRRAADEAHDPGGSDGGLGEADEASYADAVDPLGGVSDGVPVGLTTTALPTIQEIFAQGEGLVLDEEQELLAIKNGWNAQN